MKIGILGAGTWGTALSFLLYNNNHEVTLWSALSAEIDELNSTHRHRNLPDTLLPNGISFTKDISEAASDKEIVIFVVPSEFMRSTARLAAPFLSDGVTVLTASKGIERGTLCTMSQIVEQEFSVSAPDLGYELVALSGPTHAEEVAMGLPTSIVAACKNEDTARSVAQIFSSTCLRAYTNTDVVGVEICGALKNIIAIAAGIIRGMGFGDNACAMLITRGIAEMTRIGLALGCDKGTFMGLAGVGDLIVTATSHHSRNNRCGELIGKGFSYDEAAAQIGMVVEGYHSLEAAIEMSEKYGVEMPITRAVYDVIKNGVSPKDAMLALMQRDIKNELHI